MRREKKFTYEGISYTAREFALDSYPQTDKAFRSFAGEDKAAQVDAIHYLLEQGAGMPAAIVSEIPIMEALDLMSHVLEINGFSSRAESLAP